MAVFFCLNFVIVSDAEIEWCQEEPMNMGDSSYMAPRLCTAMKATGRGSWEDIKFVGRGPSASTATGFAQVHKSEQAEIVQLAMKPQPVKLVCWAIHKKPSSADNSMTHRGS